MEVFSLRFRRYNGPTPFSSAVIASLQAIAATVLLLRVAWPFQKLHTLAVICAVAFLFLTAVALYRVWKFYRVAYPKAAAGDQAMTHAVNTTLKTYSWANIGFMLLALTVFQFSLLLK
jgi:hypothetical protein